MPRCLEPLASSLILCLALLHAVGAAQDLPSYHRTRAELERVIVAEMRQKELPAFAIALVDGDATVWSKSFGAADPEKGVAASGQTRYRVGSISKIFTSIAVMQLVERGVFDLDAPLAGYVGAAMPRGAGAVTLRHVLAHSSGIVREPPRGSYFDATSPDLTATVASLAGTTLVYRPGSRVKYSNAAISLAGHAVARATGTSFARYVEQAILAPCGMDASSFTSDDGLGRGFMWSYDGRRWIAPTFRLGIEPAGGLRATIGDLAQFVRALFRGGRGRRGRILQAETLEAMYRPSSDRVSPFGIGFSTSRIGGHRAVGHGGAVYGFASQLWALPDEELGVIAVTTMDCANTVVDRIARHALHGMLAEKDGRAPEVLELTKELDRKTARSLAGLYADELGRARLIARDDALYAEWAGRRARVRARGDRFVIDDRHAGPVDIEATGSGLRIGKRELARIEDTRPAPASRAQRDVIGLYGWDHNTLVILERDGALHALIEWFFYDRLVELGPDRHGFPAGSLYSGEELRFERDAAGAVRSLIMAGIRFPILHSGAGSAATFRIEPVQSEDELRRAALNSRPPIEPGTKRLPDLVDLLPLDGTIRYDIRYAGTNNFMNMVFYDEARALLQRPAAEALVRAHRRLGESGFGLLVHDAYRPWYVTRMFWDATPASQKDFVADPGQGSRHNRGCAVDLTLFERESGDVVEMTGGYDEFSERSYPDFGGGTSRQRWHRELLRRTMEDAGFSVYQYEWWHFDFHDWRSYPVLNLRFAELGGN